MSLGFYTYKCILEGTVVWTGEEVVDGDGDGDDKPIFEDEEEEETDDDGGSDN